MMKAGMAAAMLAVTVLGNCTWAEDGTKTQAPPEIRLTLDLVDGSRIVGTPVIESVPVQTSYAKMDLPLKQILALRVEADHETAQVDLRNGDTLTGVISLQPIKLDTVFGKVRIGVEYVREIRVVLGGAQLPDALWKGLVLYCNFDEGGTDSSGGERDLSLVGEVGFASGLTGQALSLHGDGRQYAVRPNDDAVLNFGTNDFTISVCASFNQTRGEQTLVEKFSGGSGPGWTLTKLANNALHFYARPCVTLTTEPVSIPKDGWHQILVRKRGSLCQIMYDGTPLVAASTSGGIPATTAPLLVGKRNPDGGQDFPVDGRIDECAIWARALSDAEIASLASKVNGKPKAASEAPR